MIFFLSTLPRQVSNSKSFSDLPSANGGAYEREEVFLFRFA